MRITNRSVFALTVLFANRSEVRLPYITNRLGNVSDNIGKNNSADFYGCGDNIFKYLAVNTTRSTCYN